MLSLRLKSPDKKHEILHSLRLEGMEKANLKKVVDGEQNFHVEQRSSQKEFKMCNSCNAFISKRYMYTHRCKKNKLKNVGISFTKEEPNAYDNDVVHRYRLDEVGKI